MFRATVAENVRLAAPGADDNIVVSALTEAGAIDFVGELPLGIETEIGEGGRPLSAGQAQRIALARAFACDAPLLILDEPTAHLDAESEALVTAAVEKLIEHRTTLLIVHRPELAAIADRVLELRDGHIVADGQTPAASLEAGR